MRSLSFRRPLRRLFTLMNIFHSLKKNYVSADDCFSIGAPFYTEAQETPIIASG